LIFVLVGFLKVFVESSPSMICCRRESKSSDLVMVIPGSVLEKLSRKWSTA